MKVRSTLLRISKVLRSVYQYRIAPLFKKNHWIWKKQCQSIKLTTPFTYQPVWIIGSGRSGTTWASEVINYDQAYREIFEPIHPGEIESAGFLELHHYVRPSDNNQPQLKLLTDAIFSGNFYHERVDQDRSKAKFKGLLVKDIFANLMAKWVSKNINDIKIILLIRNPFAVAASISKTQHWIWPTDPRELLKQTDLYEDFLEPHAEFINYIADKNDFILNQIVIWCIIHIVPLQQFSTDEINISFYENIYLNPEQEIQSLLQYVKGEEHQTVEIDPKVIKQPSKMIGDKSTLFSDKSSPITAWTKHISEQQMQMGQKILRHFCLDQLYNKDGLPNPTYIAQYQKQFTS